MRSAKVISSQSARFVCRSTRPLSFATPRYFVLPPSYDVVFSSLGTCRGISSASASYWANQKQTTYAEEDKQQWKRDFPQLEGYGLDAIQEWRNAFDIFDQDHDGFISRADLQKNFTFSIEKAALLQKYDRDQNNLIDFGEFVEAMYNVDIRGLRSRFDGFDDIDMKLEFDKYAQQDEAGTKDVILLRGIEQLVRHQDFTVTHGEVAQRLMAEMDTGKDGVVDLNEFKAWLRADSS